jgi:hypothetical protein
MLFGLVVMFGIVLGIMLIAFDDGIPFALFHKLRCKAGWHKNRVNKVNKYYCQFCKRPRKFPELKLIDGGNKMANNKYEF